MQARLLRLVSCLAAIQSLSSASVVNETRHLYASATLHSFHSTDKPNEAYGNHWDKSWIIHTNHYVRCRILQYDVEECCDKVFIYSQYTESTGGQLQVTAQSRYHKGVCDFADCEINGEWFNLVGPIRVRFVTDSSVVKKGFLFTYKTYPYSFGCPSTKTNFHTGWMKFKNRNVVTYGNNWDCSRLIHRNCIMRLKFSDVDVQHHKDKVYLYEDSVSVNSSKLHAVVSSRGHFRHTYYLQGPVVVRFKTDEEVVGEGFTVHHKCLKIGYGCSSSELHAPSGIIRSQLSLLKTYGNNWDCKWTLPAANQLYRLTFTSYDLQYGADNVYFYENTTSVSSPPLVTLSNRTLFGREYFLHGPVTIRFTTDASVIRRGFSLSYSTVPDSFDVCSTKPCGEPRICRPTRSSYTCDCPPGHREIRHECVLVN